MKTLKTTSLVALLALSAASLASAQTIIHITGSTAYRGSTITAIVNVLKANGTVTAAYSGGSLTSANESVIFGPGTGSSETIVEASFSGSVGGLQTLTGNGSAIATFPSSTYASQATAVTPGGGTTAATGGFSISGTPTFDPPVAPDLSLSDVFKASTPYNQSNVTQTTVGVVPFKFVVNGSAPSGVTNITNQIARLAFGAGSVPVSFFTGSHSDETSTVIGIGRDNDSGTRLTAFAESGLGTSTPANQSFPLNAAGQVVGNSVNGVQSQGPTTSTELTPAETVNGTAIAIGNGGYSSGGNLAVGIGATDSVANTYFVTYLGTSDATTAEGGNASTPVQVPARELTFNGVGFSQTGIEEGQYTFWGFEHLDNLTSASTTVKSFVTSLKNQLNSGDDELSGDGITISAMNVTRATDGATVTPLF